MNEDGLLIPGLPNLEEEVLEQSLRPQAFDEYVGQSQHIENLKIFAQAAKLRQEPLDHVLLSGPPGLGKTTLAHILARELGSQIFVTSGPALEKKGDLAGLLTNLNSGDILFIDEIHRLHSAVEENLYPAMEDFRFDVMIGEGAHARSISLNIKPFTLIGATTKTGLLTSPLRDRFGFSARLEFYTALELARIITRSASILNIRINPDAAFEIAKRSRGTPRIANRLLRRVRDFAQVLHEGKISLEVAVSTLERLGVRQNGLDAMDHRILNFLMDNHQGHPVGLDTLAAALGESASTLEDVYEPYLLQEGFLLRTPRGRLPTSKSYEQLGRIKPSF